MSKHSSADRRHLLHRLRRTENETGPLAKGLGDTDRIVVASFFSPYVCRRFRRALAAAGVRSATRKDGSKWYVEVGYAQREVAQQLVARQKSEYPDQRPQGRRGAFDFTILGCIAGGLAGVVSLGLANGPFLQAVMWAGFMGTGLAAGYLADRFQRSYRYLGHLQFDMADCLLLITLIAMVLAFWVFVSRFL